MTGIARRHRSIGRLAAAPLVVSALIASAVLAGSATAQPTPPQPASAQPSLPKPLDGSIPSASPIIGGGSSGGGSSGAGGSGSSDSGGRRAAARHASRTPLRSRARRRVAAHGRIEPLERPALAGVELVAPLPVPVQPPHFTVPTPAYLPENAATFYTTPLPPVICHRVPRDPYAPDPHLIRETTVLCEADNP